MISYELAKKLKDAGFPHITTSNGKIWIGEDWQSPTLSQLIEACGEVTVLLWGCKAHGYYASSQPCMQEMHEMDSCVAQVSGSTPEEAVSLLWLELRKLKKIDSVVVEILGSRPATQEEKDELDKI